MHEASLVPYLSLVRIAVLLKARYYTMSLLSLPVIGNALLIFVFAIFVYFKYAHSYWERKNVQCPKPSFPFGNVGWVVLQKQSIADKVLRTYGAMKRIGCKYCGLYFFSRAAFIPMDPALIKNILCKDFQHFNDRGIYYDEENDPVSAHLFSLSGVKWKILRTKLTPAFTGGKIKYMFDSIFECADQMISKLNANLRIDDAVEIKEILARFTTDVIGSCAFGIDCNSMTHANAEFRIMGKRAFTQTPGDALKMVIIRSFPKLAKFLGIGCFPPEVSKFFKEVVQKTITYREEQNIIRNDFLQLLIQLKNNGCLEGHNEDEKLLPGSTLSMDEAAAQAFIFFLAGFETTSTAMSFALFELARQEQLQNRSRQEVTMILKKYDEKFCYDAIMEMTYLDTVLLGKFSKKIYIVCFQKSY